MLGQDGHRLVGAELPIDQLEELLGLELPAAAASPGGQPLAERFVLFGEQPRKEVVGQCSLQALGLLDELRIEGESALEGALLQRPLTEAVDREDRGLVEALERPAQVRRARFPFGGRDRLSNAQPDALPQLRRRGLGERHDQDVGGTQPMLDQQAEIERRQREGLSGAGARLDEGGPDQRDLPGIERLDRNLRRHRADNIRTATSGSKNSRASTSKPKRTPASAARSIGERPSQIRTVSSS